jgi:FAD/FMN-containing dehydrogenase
VPEGWLNDASLLSPTPVRRHVTTDATGDALIEAIRAEMTGARTAGRPVALSAARHSMGGQSLPRDGHAMTCDANDMEVLDAGTAVPPGAGPEMPGTRLYRVHSGARWRDVIAALDPIGLSPKVMQSNHDFGVAATFCVNAHGWPAPFGPMGSSVRSLRKVAPSGEVVTCSRAENPELFAMAMGGYGLTGAIVDLVVEAVPNTRLEPRFATMPAGEFAGAFRAALDAGDAPMAYGRLDVSRRAFFEEALLITYHEAADQTDLPPAAGSGMMAHAARHLYRAQLGRETVKRARWWTETVVGPALSGAATRNSLINEPVVTLDDRDPTRTDILHEYFVPFDGWDGFLALCRAVIPGSFQEFLNVTLRFVDTDAEAWLSYASVPRIAAVMSFSQEMSARAEADMARMTRELVGGVLDLGGSYYLPYRPHPTPEQFKRAYPRAGDFAAAKRAMDPDLIFRNALWDRYLETT